MRSARSWPASVARLRRRRRAGICERERLSQLAEGGRSLRQAFENYTVASVACECDGAYPFGAPCKPMPGQHRLASAVSLAGARAGRPRAADTEEALASLGPSGMQELACPLACASVESRRQLWQELKIRTKPCNIRFEIQLQRLGRQGASSGKIHVQMAIPGDPKTSRCVKGHRVRVGWPSKQHSRPMLAYSQSRHGRGRVRITTCSCLAVFSFRASLGSIAESSNTRVWCQAKPEGNTAQHEHATIEIRPLQRRASQ